MKDPARRALDAYRKAMSKEEAYDAAYRALSHATLAVKRAEERLETAREGKTDAAALVHRTAGAFVDALRHAEEAYAAAEEAGAVRDRGPTELNDVNRESISRQADKASELRSWLKLLD
ncbi:MAG: hypothetical protein OXI39_15310 [Gemmatimonadota bacterium]|uniref:hypothetical protein n=1 Tax=Candidatus Palauibacter scopulicola TaxID=3056741 RepID=UPI00238209DD|nr:hypothetical protein [Candidatus Palauibacter scopulicola]MDE2664354.1 hypothetical protein [Candidatus Palauibacter scopulicola]